MDDQDPDIKYILLVEDDPRDVELTLAALEEQNLANKVFVVNDGAEAMETSVGAFELRLLRARRALRRALAHEDDA